MVLSIVRIGVYTYTSIRLYASSCQPAGASLPQTAHPGRAVRANNSIFCSPADGKAGHDGIENHEAFARRRLQRGEALIAEADAGGGLRHLGLLLG
jgi:hypothetical protein